MKNPPKPGEAGSNVTLEPPAAEPRPAEPVYIKCFLCRAQLRVLDSKRGKPYFICDPCGLQVFVRKERGIRLLGRRTTPVRKVGSEVVDLISQFELVSERLSEIEGDRPWFSKDPELGLKARALRREKAQIIWQLRGRRPKAAKRGS